MLRPVCSALPRLRVYVSLLLLSCQGYETSELLDGKFLSKDLNPIDLLAPSDKSVSTTRTPLFSWTRRAGATKYLLELSTDANFSTRVLSKTTSDTTYTLVNNDLSGVTSLDVYSYYWRVTAIYADQQVTSGYFIFHVLDNSIVYVNGSATASEQVGNKSAPFKKIQAGIEAADTKRSGVTTVAMEVRVAAGTYTEEVTIKPRISLLGGYEATNWTRNISNNLTTIQAPTDVAVRGNSATTSADTSATTVEGFTIKGGNLLAANNYAIFLVNSAPTITNNVISGGAGTNNYGIYTSIAAARILSNSITGGPGSNNYGIYTDSNSSATIANNTILGGTTNSGTHFGIYINISAPIISNNLVFGGPGFGVVHGIYDTGGGTAMIVNNTINGGSSGTTLVSGIYLTNGATPNIRNNIIFTTGGTNRYCIYELAVNADPSAFQNNNLYDCPTALYRDENATNVTNLTTAITAPTSDTLANFGNISVSNTSNQLFADLDGPDNIITTVADNDWHLTTNAAICDVRAGGLNLTTIITADKDGNTRTTDAVAGCAPANTGATNWSMGAYESN